MDTFQPFPKIARYSRDIVITEKIDGTNAQIFIKELPDDEVMPTDTPLVMVIGHSPGLLLYAGSRSRWLTPGKSTDNHGFAAWVAENAEELVKLGPGRHFGEWWGKSINRGYGLDHKSFSLFNVHKWADPLVRPSCCSVVPVLYQGGNNSQCIELVLTTLTIRGSFAAPGFMDPEGIVIYHTAAKFMLKKTIKDDEKPKG
jgi:hypothetical protein